MKYVTYAGGRRARGSACSTASRCSTPASTATWSRSSPPARRVGATARRRGRAPARAAAPALAARLPRLRGPPEERLRAARPRRSRPEWYEVPAYYKGMPDTVIGPEDEVPWPALDGQARPRAGAGRGDRRRRARHRASPTRPAAIFGYTIWNDLSARDVQARELPVGMGPGKAKDWDGSNVLGPCIATPDEVDLATRPHARARERRGLGGGHAREHAPLLRGHDRLRSRGQTLRAGEVLGSGTAAGGSGLELDRWLQAGRRRRARDRRDRRAAQPHRNEGELNAWRTSSPRTGARRRARRSGWPR